MQASVAAFDAFLQKSGSDSSDWADAGGAEEAEEALAGLPQQDWLELETLCSSREAKWRGCLVSILRPQQGSVAERLMLELAWDQDTEVAFLAVSGIAFYCGVNDSAKGPFVDLTIRSASFLALAKTKVGLADQIREIGATSYSQFQSRFALLVAVLQSEA